MYVNRGGSDDSSTGTWCNQTTTKRAQYLSMISEPTKASRQLDILELLGPNRRILFPPIIVLKLSMTSLYKICQKNAHVKFHLVLNP
jgi:hypothetical protein